MIVFLQWWLERDFLSGCSSVAEQTRVPHLAGQIDLYSTFLSRLIYYLHGAVKSGPLTNFAAVILVSFRDCVDRHINEDLQAKIHMRK